MKQAPSSPEQTAACSRVNINNVVQMVFYNMDVSGLWVTRQTDRQNETTKNQKHTENGTDLFSIIFGLFGLW